MEKLKIGELKEKQTKVFEPGEIHSPNYVFSINIDLNLYNDISSCNNWHLIGSNIYDYIYVRTQIKLYISGTTFDSLSEIDKEIVIKYCATDSTTIITHYMMQGMSQADATYIYITNRSVDIKNAAESCSKRITSPTYIKYIIMFLPEETAQQFLDATRNFSLDYQSAALFGNMYGDGRDGIMDYIDGTGSYVGGGLRNYTTYVGTDINQLIFLLNDLLINGNI